MNFFEGIDTFRTENEGIRKIEKVIGGKEIIDKIFEKEQSGVIFGSTGGGKTTLIKRLIKESNEKGIIKNVYVSDIEDGYFEKGINVVKFDKRKLILKGFARLCNAFDVERVFYDEVRSEEDIKLIKEFMHLEIPIVFVIHGLGVDEVKKRIEIMSTKEDADYIMGKLEFSIGVKRYEDENKKIKRQMYLKRK